MSGESWSYFTPVTVAELKAKLDTLPDGAIVKVPSINRCPGEFINLDHVFYERGEVCLDGDIAERHKEKS